MPEELIGAPASPVVFAPLRDGTTIALPRFEWDANSIQAAADIAEGVPNREIAQRAGIHSVTLSEWRRHPDFIAKVEEFRKFFCEMVMQNGLARKEVRIAKLTEDFERIDEAIKGMAEMSADLPGGGSGLMRRRKVSGDDEIKTDTALLAERREILKHIAIEKGEWQDGDMGNKVAVQIVLPAAQLPPTEELPTVTIGRSS